MKNILANYKSPALVTKKPNPPKWTTADDKFLKENLSKYSNEVLGELLGRSEEAIQQRFRKLGYGYKGK